MSDTITPVTTTVHLVTVESVTPGITNIAVHATVEVADCKYSATEVFIGSDHGTPGPVTWITGNRKVDVPTPERFGEKFNEEWARAFFAPNVCGSPMGFIDASEYCVSCERDNREGHYDNCAL